MAAGWACVDTVANSVTKKTGGRGVPPFPPLHSATCAPTPPRTPIAPATPHHGDRPRVLGISLFDGIGSFWLCLQPHAGTAFEWAEQVSCEIDEACVRVLEHRFPNVKHWGDASRASAERLNELVDRVRPDFVLLNGSCPSLNLSSANAAAGGLGADSPFWEFTRVASILSKACLPLKVELIQLFDCVVPQRAAWQDDMSEALGLGPPLFLDAADVSYCSRPPFGRVPPFSSSSLPSCLAPTARTGVTCRSPVLVDTCRHCLPFSRAQQFRGA